MQSEEFPGGVWKLVVTGTGTGSDYVDEDT